jgi:uncharacterized protein YfaT (DUF1175 family)
MFAFLKRRQFTFALVLWFALVLLISYFLLGRNRKSAAPTGSTHSSKSTSTTSTLAHAASLDSDNDGLPDAAELQSFMDRENFRQWFTLIAEGQFYHPSDQWNTEQRDCAGLVRFAWREALRRHDRTWFQKMGPGYQAVAPDVGRYTLEQGPLGAFSDFADARTLKNFNVKFISRDRHNAAPGDLLFFYQPWVQKFPFHVMLFVGNSKFSNEPASDWVIYHTGASPNDEGTVKKVELSVLDHHPNKRWRPVDSNTNFLGFYRLKILD